MFSSLLVAAVAVFPLVTAGSSSVPNCARTYTVKEGDYCDLISASQNVSTYQLMTVNYPTINDACSNLQVNQMLCLGTTGEDCTTTYVVQPNDTWDMVADKSGVNTTILHANNPESGLYIGEVLCTSPTVCVPPAPAGRPTSTASIAPDTAPAQPAPTQPTPASSSSTPASSSSSDDDDDLPWCEDPNDDGEW